MAAGAQQGLVQDLGAVCRADDQNTLGCLETVHLGEQLVEGLLALLIASAVAGIAAAADGVDLIDENNAGCILIGFFEQVTHTGGAHADIELDEIRARQGEKGHMRLTGHGLCQQSLSGSGRAHEQGSLGKLGADLDIAAGIVQEIDDLHQGFLGLVFTCHVLEGDTGLLLYIFLGRALSYAHDTASASAHAAEEHTEKPPHQQDGKHIGQNKGHHHSGAVRHIGIIGDLGIHQALGQSVLGFGHTCVEHRIRVLEMDLQPVGLHVDLCDLLLLDIFDKVVIGNLARLTVFPHEIAESGKQGDCHDQNDKKILTGLAVSAAIPVAVAVISVPVVSVIAISAVSAVSGIVAGATSVPAPERVKKPDPPGISSILTSSDHSNKPCLIFLPIWEFLS